MPYPHSVSEEVEGELTAMFDKLLRQKATGRKSIRTPADVDKLVSDLRLTIQRGMRVGHDWAQNDLQQVFNQAYAENGAVTKAKSDIDAAYRLRKKSKESMHRLETGLNTWADNQGKAIVASKQLEALEGAMSKAKGQDFVKLRKQAQQIRPLTELGTDIPEVSYFAKRGKRAEVARMPGPTYMRMVLKTGHVDNENQGFIRGAARAGIEELMVIDGDECGWITHDSSPLADGMTVSVKEAQQHPKAHPNCQRGFTIVNRDQKKAAEQRAKARARAAKAAKAAARKATLQKVAKAAQTTAKAAAVGYKIYRSPATQILIQNIVQERYALPPALQEFVVKFGRYEAQEKAVASLASITEKQEVTPEEVRQRILTWADGIIGAEDDTHAVPPAMQKVLGLPASASTNRITEATWSYGDWLAKNRAATVGAVDNLVDSSVWAAARSELHSDVPVFASMFHVTNPRGVNVGAATGQTIRVIKDAFRKDADQITEEAVRELARIIDPFPWAKAQFGPFKMSLGMSTEGRADLAGKMFKQIRDARRWSEVDQQLAKELGVTLVEKVNADDVRKALLPRLTMNPGGLLSFTISSEDGTIKPIFRVLPQWGWTKFLQAETTLASGAAGRIKALVDEGGNLGDILSALPDELISHLNLYRNGPFNAHLNFWGTRWNGYSVYMFKDSDWIRFANRFRRFERVGPDLGQIVPLNRMWNELSVMPTSWSTVTFTGKNKQWDVIANLHHWSGSLVHVARELHLDYFSLKTWFSEAQKAMNYYATQMHAQELASVRSYDDLKAWAEGFKDNTQSLAGQFDPVTRPVGNHNVSPLLEHNASRALLQDIERFNNAWDQLFPHVARPNLDIYVPGSPEFENKSVPMFYRGSEAIYFRDDMAQNWADMARARRRNTFIGFWSPGTEDPVASIWHEAGHYLYHPLQSTAFSALQARLRSMTGVPKYVSDRFKAAAFDMRLNMLGQSEPDLKADFISKLQEMFLGTPEMRGWVRRNLSGYATRNIHELVAEAFAEYTMSKNPRVLAQVIGRWLAVYGGQAGI